MIETEMLRIVDYLIVTSDYLCQYYDNTYGTNAIVIEDAIEVDKKLVKKHSDKNRIEIVWVGSKDNWKTLDIIHKALKKLNDKSFYLKTISDHPEADIQWNIKTVYTEILKGDIATIPCFTNEWGKAKSNNRLTMFMALGLPVIVSPIQSYKKIIRHGNNGFLAKNINDWVKYLLLSKDITIRRNIGRKAKEDVVKRYSIEVIGDRWLSLINRILGLEGNIQYC
jgi:glycosyltransferase involved in cell wall biosynthesis